jgi:DNA-binding transcriptional regulator YhcF (GntR family)
MYQEQTLNTLGGIVRRRDLRASELKIYGYLAELATVDAFATPSYRRMAEVLGYSVQTIWRGVVRLERMGCIRRKWRKSIRWGNKSNFYAVDTRPFGKKHTAEKIDEIFNAKLEDIMIKTNDKNIVKFETEREQSHNVYYV